MLYSISSYVCILFIMLSGTASVPNCQVEQQTSETKCVLNKTFGCFVNGTMWTRGGCHGMFTCESMQGVKCGNILNGGTGDICKCRSADPTLGCMLEHQTSDTKCVLDGNFGCFGNRTMWTSGGCRGIFTCDAIPAVVCDVMSDDNPIHHCKCVSASPLYPAPAFRFAQIYSDGMVLQAAPKRASIWGYGKPGAKVLLRLRPDDHNNTDAEGIVDASGKWRILLPPQNASFNQRVLTASSNGVAIEIKDVLFGDVWVCSGQSNMAFSAAVPLTDPTAEERIAAAYANDAGATFHGKYLDAQAGIDAAAKYPDIRLLVVGNKKRCAEPIEDFYPSINDTGHMLAHRWARASPDNVGLGPDVMGGVSGGFSSVCWNFGLELRERLRRPIGLIHSSYGGSAVEDWISRETLGDGQSGPCVGPIVTSMGLPSQQYNGQIRPLLNMTIQGAIWYQGEANAGQNDLYTCRFQLMIDEWRRQWHSGTDGATISTFPIGCVQVGPLGTGDNVGPAHSNKTFAIRMGQTANYGYAPNVELPKTFMATAFDLANPNGTKCYAGCVHIFNKQAVAHRLAIAAMRVAYEQQIVYSGPRVQSLVSDGVNAVLITYGVGTEGGGLDIRSNYGFEVCRQGCFQSGDNLFKNGIGFAPATIIEASKTTVKIKGPSDFGSIAVVRYGYDDMPSLFFGTQPAVYNKEGLPATPGIYNVTSTTLFV